MSTDATPPRADHLRPALPDTDRLVERNGNNGRSSEDIRAHGGPAQGGPAQGGPAQDEPAQDEPAQGAPAQDGPAEGGIGEQSARLLWSALPVDLATEFRPHAETMARNILDEIQTNVPEFAQPLDGPFGEVITQGISQAVLHCIERIESTSVPEEDWANLFRRLGKIEFKEGRSLNSLQAAYRIGGRTAWRYLSSFGRGLGLSTEMLCLSAEAIFAYVDEISSLSVAGYSQAQVRAAGTLARRRARLLELILADPPVTPHAVQSLAVSANWTMPEQVSVIALEPTEGDTESPNLALDGEVLTDLESAQPCLLTPDVDRHLPKLEPRLRDRRAAIGPRVPVAEARTSLLWARRTLDLVLDGSLPNQPVTTCDDHLVTLWLLSDEFLADQLGKRCLAPLDGLTSKQRTRFADTLLAWLQCRGNTPDIAEMLEVHPQTVRYRMHQLNTLFGERLNDPEERLTLEIALRANRLKRAGRRAVRRPSTG
jgi:hypothetical protein